MRRYIAALFVAAAALAPWAVAAPARADETAFGFDRSSGLSDRVSGTLTATGPFFPTASLGVSRDLDAGRWRARADFVFDRPMIDDSVACVTIEGAAEHCEPISYTAGTGYVSVTANVPGGRRASDFSLRVQGAETLSGKLLTLSLTRV